MAAPKSTAVVVKKKKWVPILAPKLFNEQMLGESFVEESGSLVGRRASVSLMVLTNDPQKQAISVSFVVKSVENERAMTELVSYRMLPAAAKKLMRRRRSKIEDSFVVETADKKVLRVKPLIIARSHAKGSVMASMQKLERAFIAKAISKLDFDGFVRDVVQKKLQSSLGQTLRRLYPVGVCEIRMFELISQEKVKELGIKVMLPPTNLPDYVPRKRQQEQSETPSEQPQPVQADSLEQSA
ncbi:hypothetical protein HY489_05575 [Candidatus Woesearchaeota archaeon]|nr:hypothetical protein [Candidatus Woesearchaeota archaeon]